jgi:exopolyphosphatase/guanosine-5'-triphosphate,3'-diphosphate pyrophosphatase
MLYPPTDRAHYAAVELGSDSFRLHVGRFEDGALRLVATLAEPVRLASTLDEDGNLSAEAMRQAIACLGSFRLALDAWHPVAVRVVATAALRTARNSMLFLPAAGQALGRPIELIPADEAGRLVYLGVANTLGDMNDETRLVVDIGSGGAELVLGQGSRIRHIESFRFGTVRQSLTFFTGGCITAANFEAAVRSGRSRFAEAGLHAGQWRRAYGACGTVRVLAEIARQEGEDGALLTLAGLQRLRDRFIDAGSVANVACSWEAAARVSHLPGGLALVIALMEEFEVDALVAVDAGLRVGALWDLYHRTGALAAG